MASGKLAGIALALTCCVGLAASSAARAQDGEVAPFLETEVDTGGWEAPEEEAVEQPARILVTVGAGTSLRLVQNLDLSQDRVAPPFVDLFGAYVLPSTGLIRHGVGVGVSTNLTGDGNFTDGVDPFEQFVAGLSYVGHVRPDEDLAASLKVGIPLALTPAFAPGLELSVQLAYLLTAGLGVYGEIGASAFLGLDTGDGSTVHPVASAELGVLVDYEVLP